jgi:hypothetical protein
MVLGRTGLAGFWDFGSCMLGIAGLAGKVALLPRVLFFREIDLVLRLYPGGITAVKPMVLFRGATACKHALLP